MFASNGIINKTQRLYFVLWIEEDECAETQAKDKKQLFLMNLPACGCPITKLSISRLFLICNSNPLEVTLIYY